jgi:hypothetical protein
MIRYGAGMGNWFLSAAVLGWNQYARDTKYILMQVVWWIMKHEKIFMNVPLAL